MNRHRPLQNVHSGWSPFAAIAITTLVAVAVSIYSLLSGWVIIFQNLLYVPIVIACMYYAQKGFLFSVVLSLLYLFLIVALIGDSAAILQAAMRVFIFAGVAGVITFLSAKRSQVEEELRQHRGNLEKLVEDRTAELKQMAEEAKQLKQKIELILGATNTGLDIIDSAFHIRYIDPERQKVYGDPKGRKCYEYFLGRSDACPDCRVRNALTAQQVTVTEDVLPKQGNRPIQVTRIPFRDENGDWLVAEIDVDITERKQAQMEARRHQEELVRVSRLSTLGEMASGIAHELNQPLAAIGNYGDACLCLLQSEAPDVPRIVRNLQQVVSQSERAGAIIRKMRALVKKKEIELAPVNLNEVIQSILPSVRSEMADKAVQLKLELAEPLPQVLTDAVQMEQVVLNLIRNAMEALDGVDEPPRLLTIRTKVMEQDRVQMEVCDTGVGLPAEEPHRIFEPFFTTKASGLGLGLSISRSIVQMHKGSLAAIRDPDRGSTFVVTLPAERRENR